MQLVTANNAVQVSQYTVDDLRLDTHLNAESMGEKKVTWELIRLSEVAVRT